MSFTDFFIRRAITTTLLMTGLLVFGIIAYFGLPVSDLPAVDFPTISVNASLPGASPEVMANSVATPLERQFTTIPGISSMNSTSSLGSTSITLQFDLTRDIDAAASDVQAAIQQASRLLPNTLPQPPTYRKVNPADQPIIYIGLSSDRLPLSRVDEIAETLIAQRMSIISGVAQVQVYGAQKYAVRVQLDPDALASRGVGIDEVRTAINNNNTNLPAGVLNGANKSVTVETTGQLTSADQFRPLIVAYRNGSPVRLGELGHVIDSVENDRAASWFNNKRAILLAVQRQPGTNTVEIVDSIKQLLPQLREQIPAGVEMGILFDRSQPIRESINDVKFTLLLTILLVVAVIFFFLRNFRATIIPSVAVPLSLVGTFAVMKLLGYTLDNLSAMALTLSVGFVVDDAIVVLENIVRHREMGKDRLQAAIDGAREIRFTIVSMTISLVAVFIPILFMGGIVGRLLREFAVVISVAILLSGVISLVLSPMLSSRFLKEEHEQQRGRFYRWSERLFEGMLNWYDHALRWVLGHRFITIAVNLVLVAITAWLFVITPKGFFPPEDTGLLLATTEAAQDISYADMVRHQQAVAEVIGKNKYVEAYQSTVGGGGPSSAINQGRVFIRLKEEDRPGADEIIQELRPQLANIPGVRVFMQVPPSIRIGGQLSKSLYQFTLQNTDVEELFRYAPQVEAKLREVPDLTDVTSDLQLRSQQVTVQIDRDKAQSLGVSATAIQNALYDSYGQRQVSTIYTDVNQYYVVMELLPQFQTDPNALGRLYVQNNENRLIPLSTITSMTSGVAPLQITHYNQLPSVTVSFNLRPGASIGEAVNKVNETVQQMNLPQTMTTAFQGTAQAFQESLGNLWLLLLAAILVIYLVLGILYESFIHPLTILSGLPSAALGALLTLQLFGIDLNLYAFVGLILLIGIVKKNAIMMIDFALEAEREHGKSPYDAIYEGARMRFRPITMTTAAALLGTLPIALGIGAGAESRRPLGLAVVGGLLISQFITLLLTPVVYLYMEDARQWVARRFNKKEQPKPQQEPQPVH